LCRAWCAPSTPLVRVGKKCPCFGRWHVCCC